MFNKILVCLDGSETAEKIIPVVVSQASAPGTEINLLRVVAIPGGMTIDIPGSPSVPLRPASMPEQLEKEESSARAYLKKTAETIKARGVKVSIETVLGSPGPTIVSYARENGFELIAIASHGHSGLRNVLLGSTAEYVVRESGLPILMLRPE